MDINDMQEEVDRMGSLIFGYLNAGYFKSLICDILSITSEDYDFYLGAY